MTILVDLDNTISNLAHVLLYTLNERYGTTYKYEDITSYEWFDTTFDDPWQVAEEKGFWNKVSISDSAVRVIERLAKSGHQIYIVTASWIKPTLCDKITTTLAHFDPSIINSDNIIITRNKFLIDGDCLIDDCLDNFVRFGSGTKYPGSSIERYEICIAQPWNENLHGKKCVRVGSWNEIEKLLM